MEGVVVNNNVVPEIDVHRLRTSKMVLYFGIFSIIMLFAGLLSAYIITSYSELWVSIKMPTAFYYSTAIIIVSSITMALAIKASQRTGQKNAMLFLLITFGLGIGFGILQYKGWAELTGVGNYFSGSVDSLKGEYGDDYVIHYQGKELVFEDGDFYFPNDELHEKPLFNEIAIFGNSASSYLYVLSFVHLLHVLGGLIFFIALIVQRFSSQIKLLRPMRMRLGGIYWNFLGGLWIFLFLFILFIH